MRSLGADAVIDYRVEDYTRGGPYDLILDLVAYRSVFAYRRALAPGGRFLAVGGNVRTMLRILTVGTAIARFSGRRMGILVVRCGPAAFEPLAARCQTGEIAIHVDRTFPLSETPGPRAPRRGARARKGGRRAAATLIVHVAPGQATPARPEQDPRSTARAA